jgi:hypothetical protein
MAINVTALTGTIDNGFAVITALMNSVVDFATSSLINFVISFAVVLAVLGIFGAIIGGVIYLIKGSVDINFRDLGKNMHKSHTKSHVKKR